MGIRGVAFFQNDNMTVPLTADYYPAKMVPGG
jgi:hypothetical protein